MNVQFWVNPTRIRYGLSSNRYVINEKNETLGITKRIVESFSKHYESGSVAPYIFGYYKINDKAVCFLTREEIPFFLESTNGMGLNFCTFYKNKEEGFCRYCRVHTINSPLVINTKFIQDIKRYVKISHSIFNKTNLRPFDKAFIESVKTRISLEKRFAISLG